MAKKKKATEAVQYNVQVSDKTPGAPTVATTKTVMANNDADAMQKAMQNDPKAGQYKNVNVSKVNAQGVVPKAPTPQNPVPNQTQPNIIGTSPVPQTQVESKTRRKKPLVDAETMELIESLPYPYKIVVPMTFLATVSDHMPKSVTPVLFEETNRMHFKLHTTAEMKQFVESLLKDSKSTQCKILLKGIRESV